MTSIEQPGLSGLSGQKIPLSLGMEKPNNMPTTPIKAIEKWKEHVTKNDLWVKEVAEKPRTL